MTECKVKVDGMTCSSCAATVSKIFEKNGFQNVQTDYTSGSVKFTAEHDFDLNKIGKSLSNLGYHIISDKKNNEDHSNHHHSHSSKIGVYLFVCSVFTFPFLVNMFFDVPFMQDAWVQLFICLPVFIIGTIHFGRSAVVSTMLGSPNMDVLIFIGSAAAFFYSSYGGLVLHNNDYLFFETTCTIITLVLLGNWIEGKSVKATRAAIESLIKMQPATARRINFYGNEKFEVTEQVDTDILKEGDYLLLNNGDRIPCDGTLVWGSAAVDESMITGESIPVAKEKGSDLISGSLIADGSIKMKVTRAASNSTLHHIIEMIENAVNNKPQIQKFADKITVIFVPAVLGISAITFLLSMFLFHLSFTSSLMHSIAVLVISCPCAMGLATPTAVMVGMGLATRRGILINGSDTLETFGNLKQIVFDKTGTLTTGNFSVGKFKTFGVNEEEAKSIIVSLELHSSHPIAASLVKIFNSSPVSLNNIVEQKGIGISGTDAQGNIFQFGSSKLLPALIEELKSFQLFLLKNNNCIAAIGLNDEIKPEAKFVIQKLKQKGINCILLSGDNIEKCNEVAAAVGIETVYAGKLPNEKLEIIGQLSEQKITAMVGDGINDAPALSRANIGISLSNASQVAIQSAQVILMNGNLNLLVDGIEISRQTVKAIKQNLFWAFFYNVVAIPLAAVGFLSPMISALSMAFSDVMVFGNSLRLRLKKI